MLRYPNRHHMVLINLILSVSLLSATITHQVSFRCCPDLITPTESTQITPPAIRTDKSALSLHLRAIIYHVHTLYSLHYLVTSLFSFPHVYRTKGMAQTTRRRSGLPPS